MILLSVFLWICESINNALFANKYRYFPFQTLCLLLLLQLLLWDVDWLSFMVDNSHLGCSSSLFLTTQQKNDSSSAGRCAFDRAMTNMKDKNEIGNNRSEKWDFKLRNEISKWDLTQKWDFKWEMRFQSEKWDFKLRFDGAITYVKVRNEISKWEMRFQCEISPRNEISSEKWDLKVRNEISKWDLKSIIYFLN